MHRLASTTLVAGLVLSWDWFGRSSSPQNARLTQHFADVLEDRSLIDERTDKLVYSVDDGRFLPDRYIEGTCPVCGHRPARGDQCDNCSSLLDPIDLIDPYSVVSGSTNLEIRETRHLYLLQSKLQPQIRAWVEGKADWPSLARSIAYKHLDEGLIDRGITRDLAWGVPVMRRGLPRTGFEDKVFYVWFDAPVEYIAATQEWSDATGEDWRSWWREDAGAKAVRYVQFMGKDNVAFHTVSFPATILGSGEPWKTVDTLKAFNWLNWYGEPFSTSKRRGVFMDAALEILPPDCWRWYLTANSPEHADSAFTWDPACCLGGSTRDLADVLGNFVNRIVKFMRNQDGRGRAGRRPAWRSIEARLYSEVSERIAEITAQFEAIEVRKSAQALRALWVTGNTYLQEAAPWTAIKTDPDRAAVIVRTAINLVALIARVSAPVIPFAAETIALALSRTPASARLAVSRRGGRTGPRSGWTPDHHPRSAFPQDRGVRSGGVDGPFWR